MFITGCCNGSIIAKVLLIRSMPHIRYELILFEIASVEKKLKLN